MEFWLNLHNALVPLESQCTYNLLWLLKRQFSVSLSMWEYFIFTRKIALKHNFLFIFIQPLYSIMHILCLYWSHSKAYQIEIGSVLYLVSLGLFLVLFSFYLATVEENASSSIVESFHLKSNAFKVINLQQNNRFEISCEHSVKGFVLQAPIKL